MQLLPILFDIPAEGRGEFMTNAEILEQIVTYGNIKKPISTTKLGILIGLNIPGSQVSQLY